MADVTKLRHQLVVDQGSTAQSTNIAASNNDYQRSDFVPSSY